MSLLGIEHKFEEGEGLSKFLISSLVFHILFVFSFYFSNEISFMSKNDHKVNIANASIRVDIVEMPKFTIKELKSMQKDILKGEKEKVQEIESIKKETTMSKDNDFLVKKKKKSFLDMINKMSKKKVSKKKVKIKKKRKVKGNSFGKYSGDLNKLVVAGNKLNSGKSLVGTTSEIENTIFNKYISTLPDWVRPNWKLPSYLLDQSLRCRVRVYLSSNGKVVRSEIFESSGVEEFDQRALNAVSVSSPFPSLDGEIVSRVINGEIILGFPL